MFDRLRKYYANSIQHKILITYLLIVLPIIVFSGILYNNLYEYSKNQFKYQIDLTSVQLSEQLKEVFARYNDYINMVIYDEYVNLFIKHGKSDVGTDYYINLLKQFNSINVGIKSINVYIDESLYDDNIDVFKSVKDIKYTPWYKRSIINSDAVEMLYGDDILVSQRFPDIMGHESIIALELSYGILFYSIENSTSIPCDVIIYDSINKEVVYSKNNGISDEEANYDNLANILVKNDGSETIKYNDREYLYSVNNIKGTHWKVICTSDLDSIVLFPSRFIPIMAIIILTSVIFIIAFRINIRKMLVNPILLISHTTSKLASGNFDVRLPIESNDEIGHLSMNFNEMVGELKILTNQVEKNQLELKDMELKALRAQINPHFLYNCLSAINMEAILINNDKISNLVTSLATFYRTALNKGRDITLLCEEIMNIKSYLDIQLHMRDYDFDVIYDLDDRIYTCEYMVLNLVMQPIVENCIEHGITNINYRGLIKIGVKIHNNNLVITICDNGKGISQQVMDKLINHNYGSYGVKSVYERIKIKYGNEYGIEYNTKDIDGTEVIITLPIIINSNN